MKKIFKICSILVLISIIALLFCNYKIENSTKNKMYDLQSIPKNKVGLLLGTAKYLKSGQENYYFTYRIEAAYELYQAGKIEKIVISGDNSRKDYNEPQDMMDALVALGVAPTAIHLDYAGFRTLDSVHRVNSIFGQEQFTIISQKFHNQRAIYIANSMNLNAIGYNAKDVNKHAGLKTNIREKFARVKVFVDLLFGVTPKFLGDPIVIE
nr:ElyC/SanA/YdcF family protein [uncultured Flavobacterium sp.]